MYREQVLVEQEEEVVLPRRVINDQLAGPAFSLVAFQPVKRNYSLGVVPALPMVALHLVKRSLSPGVLPAFSMSVVGALLQRVVVETLMQEKQVESLWLELGAELVV